MCISLCVKENEKEATKIKISGIVYVLNVGSSRSCFLFVYFAHKKVTECPLGSVSREQMRFSVVLNSLSVILTFVLTAVFCHGPNPSCSPDQAQAKSVFIFLPTPIPVFFFFCAVIIEILDHSSPH